MKFTGLIYKDIFAICRNVGVVCEVYKVGCGLLCRYAPAGDKMHQMFTEEFFVVKKSAHHFKLSSMLVFNRLNNKLGKIAGGLIGITQKERAMNDELAEDTQTIIRS